MKNKTIPELDVLFARGAAAAREQADRRRGIDYAAHKVAQDGRRHSRQRNLLAATFAASSRRGYSGGGVGYRIARSLRFRSSASAYLSRTPAATGSQQKFTYSVWVKRGTLGIRNSLFGQSNSAQTVYWMVEFDAADALHVYDSTAGVLVSSQLFRDPSAFLHLVVAVDTTQATAANRTKIYVNGVQVTSFGTANYPALNASLNVNTAIQQALASWNPGSSGGLYFDGYMADFYFIDNQQLDPTYFGQTDATTGAWVPKAYTGTYGTNGFYLSFSDNSALTTASNVGIGKDFSGNGNYWVTNNISITAGVTNDSLTDTPTNYGTDTGAGGEVRGNYCTWNPLDYRGQAATFADGALKVSHGSNNSNAFSGRFPDTSSKWAAEIEIPTFGSGSNPLVGIAGASCTTGLSGALSYRSDGQKYDESAVNTAYGATWAAGDKIRIEFDRTADTLVFFKNGSSQGAAFSSVTSRIGSDLCVFVRTNVAGDVFYLNAGQRAYAGGAASSGFKALCTQNLPDPAIKKPSSYFDVNTRTGTGAAFNVTGKAFQPDLVWVKGRSGATDHAIYDAVRGVQKDIGSNLATDETTQAQGVTAFNADGFSGGTLAKVNTNAATYADWLWKESATAGVDIVSYTGNGANRTISHALGVVPGLILVKSRATAGADTGWAVYHSALANTEYLKLETIAAKATGATYWNSTTPTTTVFSLGTAADVNTNSDTYIAYCFAEVAGFSKFGSYTGNGSADGPFIWCGFRPRFFLWKRTDAAGNWGIIDAGRSPYNLNNLEIYADLAQAEAAAAGHDFVSNGVKVRATPGAYLNASGGTYIYAAFAEHPFKYSRAR